jgi:hypothetical protein
LKHGPVKGSSPRRPLSWHTAALLAALLCTSAHSGAEPIIASRSIQVQTRQGVLDLQVEFAVTEDQRVRGLMGRAALAEDAGMLFLYPKLQAPRDGFWMFSTLLPLDIAFLDAGGTILAIRHMEPCPALDARDCPVYAPGVAYRAALEVNGGYFQRRDVHVGDRVLFQWPR